MLPLKDENPTRIVPFINYAMIAANVLMFLYQLSLGSAGDTFIYQAALIPLQVTQGLDLGDVQNILTSMFMHAGFAHIAGNMLYLWIFGDNVEEAMGHWRYLIFYLVGGFAAAAVHIFTNSTSVIPTVGASGAIAAVLGAYLVLYPQSRVLTLLSLGYFIRLTMVPAVIILGLWFVLQLLPGVLSLGGPDVGGVAFWAHIGGFVTGVLLGLLFRPSRNQRVTKYWDNPLANR